MVIKCWTLQYLTKVGRKKLCGQRNRDLVQLLSSRLRKIFEKLWTVVKGHVMERGLWKKDMEMERLNVLIQ
ncbi:Hypothetical predicted protein [Olea europaea subsp. europaea]|uniref:Uncharacterized protein n=1 Tax=Olea europaea subsp. europaea TaxID=158383 RepID=A0A8S0TCM6_OLEEU|nr:Hypothetical predicted protein [Olea europaea subsp. europaea]